MFLGFIGISTTISVLTFSDSIVTFLGGEGEVFHYTKDYLNTVILFATCFMCGYAMEVYIRLDGNPVFPMISVISGGLTNTILDYIFVAKFGWGIKGAALATGLSQLTTFTILLTYILRKSKRLEFIKIDKIFKRIVQIIHIGTSEFLAEVSTGLSIYVFNLAILKHIGDEGVSAFGIISYVSTFVTMAMIGFNQGLQPIVSLNLGMKKYDEIKKILKIAIVIVVITSVGFYSFININLNRIVTSFITEVDTIELTKNAMRIYSISYLLSGLNIVSAGYFTSVKKIKRAISITTLRGIIFVVLFINILPDIIGEKGIWGTVVLAESVTLIISLIFLFKTRIGDEEDEENKCNERVG